MKIVTPKEKEKKVKEDPRVSRISPARLCSQARVASISIAPVETSSVAVQSPGYGSWFAMTVGNATLLSMSAKVAAVSVPPGGIGVALSSRVYSNDVGMEDPKNCP